ncbi:exo-alpha-sialidase [Microbispora cellulosiformans]|uniref:Exo-alpha-sialidase n=1 Tax=Microbispora cellulosiformans TaxID=2614688 RepID=A0A5J5JWX5_9ACTN|nr:sialidase family protein [Microbispora cellulosiformans]KAA9374440.1 exo-alpha-sialidase [Microbispora cellulosiformans]
MAQSDRSWPEIDVVGAAVRDPVTVYGRVNGRGEGGVEGTAPGELPHEGNRVPDIAALDARRLVVAWRAGVADALDPSPTDQGAIMYGRSGDAGRTWTIGTLAADTAEHRHHYVMFLRDGETLLALLGRITIGADRDAAGNVDGFPVTMVAKRSTDGGRTWTGFPVSVTVPANTRGVVVAGKPLRHDGLWLVPYWQAAGGTTRAGVLRSADLVTWTPGGLAANPPGLSVEEPQVVVAQDDPGTLLMVARTIRGGTAAEKDAYYRSHAAYAATATSVDGGLTWSAFAVDPELPNYYVKTFFTRDSDGRYLAIYNTMAGPFTGPASGKPDQYREVLHYKVRLPGTPWGPGRLFADGTRLTSGAARGWDVYASADEYEPGRFFVAWEHNQIEIRVARLDLSEVFTGVAPGWGGWVRRGGVDVIEPAGESGRSLGDSSPDDARRLRLTSGAISRPYGPPGGFVLTFHGRVTRFPASGVGLGIEVNTGTRVLTAVVRPGGPHVLTTQGWTPVPGAGDRWRVIVDATGAATFQTLPPTSQLISGSASRSAAEPAPPPDSPAISPSASPPGPHWTLPASAGPRGVSVRSDGEAVLALVEVTDHVAGGSWQGWRLDPAGGASLLDGGLRLRSATSQVAAATLPLDVTTACDFTLEFRGRVIDDSALDPRTGQGVSLGCKVANGARRLMLTVQRSGVWTMKKGSGTWEKVLSLADAGRPATWRVAVDSAGVARLSRDGVDTGVTWVVPDSREAPQVAHWVAGTAGGNAAVAHVDWTLVTATLGGSAAATGSR